MVEFSKYHTQIFVTLSISKKLIEEAIRRRGIVEACFEKQRSPVEGALLRNERQIAILTSRRAGKTNAVLRAICRDALDHPNGKYAYIGLSRITAENIVWKELEAINEDHNLQLEMQGYRLRAIFPNGASLTLYGADQPGWLKKFKGAKYRGVVIDEAGEFDIDLQDFIFRVIRATLTDLRGTLWLIGTPGVVPSGYWFRVTNPDHSKRVRGWNVYEWHSYDNPFIEDQFRCDMQELKDIYGEALENLPWFQREWLGRWCLDTTNNVYQYSPEVNDTEEWKPHPADKYILGVDPGYSDSAALVVACYNQEKSDRLVYIECLKKSGLLFDDLADKVEAYYQKYPGLRIIGDYDSATFLAYMRERRSIPIEDAEKQKKQDAIGVMNNSLVSGKVKVLMPDCMPLAKEMMELKKDFRKSDEREEDGVKMGEWKEAPKQPNDLCDAALYVHRAALNWMYKEPEQRAEYGTDSYYDELAGKLKAQNTRRVSGSDGPWWRSL